VFEVSKVRFTVVVPVVLVIDVTVPLRRGELALHSHALAVNPEPMGTFVNVAFPLELVVPVKLDEFGPPLNTTVAPLTFEPLRLTLTTSVLVGSAMVTFVVEPVVTEIVCGDALWLDFVACTV
jgi:hypothetical protein